MKYTLKKYQLESKSITVVAPIAELSSLYEKAGCSIIELQSEEFVCDAFIASIKQTDEKYGEIVFNVSGGIFPVIPTPSQSEIESLS